MKKLEQIIVTTNASTELKNCTCTIRKNGKLVAAMYAVIDPDYCVIPVAIHGLKAKIHQKKMEEAIYQRLEEMLQKGELKRSFSIDHSCSPIFQKRWYQIPKATQKGE